jgi:hypothetical protein
VKREWQGGDVGVNLRHGYRGIFVAGCTNHGRETCWHNESGHSDPGSDERRPLVVIDPEDREEAERLAACIYSPNPSVSQIENVRAALCEFANPTPRIEEPTDPSARVFAHGTNWAKVGSWWVTPAMDEAPRQWDYLAEAADCEVSQ